MINKVIISLASNYDQEQNLHQARQCLAQVLSSCHFTDAIWTEPYSIVDNASQHCKKMYLNQLVSATTSLGMEELTQALKDIEIRLGRTVEDRHQGIVRIDLDLLLYGKQRHHLRDWDRPYVQNLLYTL